MVKRKPVAPQATAMPVQPRAPPPPPPTAPPPAIPMASDSNHVLDATEEWDNQDDDANSEWWDHSDEEDDKANKPREHTVAQQNHSYEQDLLDLSSPIESPKNHASTRSNQDVGDLGVAGISISASEGSSRPVDQHQNNPFLRRPSSQAIEPESTAVIWQESQPRPSDVPPQLSVQNFSREPLSPKLFNEWADGHIAQSTRSKQPIPVIEPENPWKGAASENGKMEGSLGRKALPPRSTSITAIGWRTNNQASLDGQNIALTGNMSPRSLAKPHIQIPTGMMPPPDVDTPSTTAKQQRAESYQIKHIRWHDAQSTENPRCTPILTQNLNGPCPLLALVNALVLSTPSTLITPLVDTLRTREQVSLGLLLDAVFDELMSDRRGGAAQQLPDVGELYSFLITLHTGMNVNPRFVQQKWPQSSDSKIGSFEQTKEMRLYSTFAIPLIHGWLPKEQEEAFGAFERLAPTYEDAQNVQFREKDLERKLQTEQLSDEEETLYIDLTSIREFLTLWPTQLTDYGLHTMNDTLQPGQFAILFRNDHFSTVYKEPRSKKLMTLVTDAGYATHDEIVWESLVDINGRNSELFAGDFKSVSHNDLEVDGPEDEGEWTTVESKRRATGKRTATQTSSSIPTIATPSLDTPSQDEASSSSQAPPHPPRGRTASEQEDHDLALALQLQEEEEQGFRRQARQQEDEATQRYLNQESSRRGPEIPPRRSNNSSAASNPPLPGPRPLPATVRNPEDGDEAPPPPYEQAIAKGSRAYVPPRNHPASEHALLRGAGTPSPSLSQRRSTSSYGPNSSSNPTQPGTSQMDGRRGPSARGNLASPYHAARGRGMPAGRSLSASGPVRTGAEEEKCNVM